MYLFIYMYVCMYACMYVCMYPIVFPCFPRKYPLIKGYLQSSAPHPFGSPCHGASLHARIWPEPPTWICFRNHPNKKYPISIPRVLDLPPIMRWLKDVQGKS